MSEKCEHAPSRTALAIMARAPSDPRGKTRLLAALGGRNATELRRALLLDTWNVARGVSGADLIVLFAPADVGDELAGLAEGACRLLPQRGEHLGERLEHAFVDLFALGYCAGGIIGSDLPTLPPEYLDSGISAVTSDEDPVVIGPAEDGGYYFIGLRKPHPELFRGIPWSTDGVLAATRAAAEVHHLAVSFMPLWYDVDSAADLRRAATLPGTAPDVARHTRAWMAARR